MPSLRDHLHQYWFRFDGDPHTLPAGTGYGCGVTAVDRSDAELLVRTAVFGGLALPADVEVIDDVDVRALDQGHLVLNMGDPTVRGVWFPRI